MKLKEIIDCIEGRFYITLPRKGVVKDIIRGGAFRPHEYEASAVREGKDRLPEGCLNSEVIVHPYDWLTLLLEIKE